MTPFGNFCLPIATPTCSRGTTPVRTAGGGFQCLPVGVVTCLNGHLADGKCVQDPPPCGAGMMRIAGGGCGPIVVTQPNCGPFATNVGGRCTPIHTGTGGESGGGVVVSNPGGSNTPPIGPIGGLPPRGTGDGSKGGGGTTTGGGTTAGGNTPPSGPDNNLCLKCRDCCILRHPPSPVGTTGNTGNTGTGGIASSGGSAGSGDTSKGSSGRIPIHQIPTGVFKPSQPPSNSKPSYVLGRGGGGLNVFKSGGPTGSSSAGKTASVGNISSVRSTPAPILHMMPSLGSMGGGGGKGPMIK